MKPRLLLCVLLLVFGAARGEVDLAAFGLPDGAIPLGSLTRLTGAEQVYWDNRPIPVTLQVGLERQISFPAGVRVGMAPDVEERLRVQSVDGTVHWLAYEPFATSRVQVRELRSGRTYLLDLSAVAEGGDGHPLEVLDLDRLERTSLARIADHPQTASHEPSAPGDPGAPPGDVALIDGPPRYDPVGLARFAFQQLHAPERLLGRLQLPGLSRVPVDARAVVLYRGGALETTPYVSWSDGFHTVTAVKLENRTSGKVLVDPRDFRGRWLARGLIHAELWPRGDPYGRDRSFVVLIAPRPFAEALP